MTRRSNRAPSHVTWIAVAITIVIGAGGALAWRTSATPVPPGTQVAAATAQATYVRRETRPTLDPARFVGKAAVTHQIAREIPDVLDQLYCYCQCDKSIGHTSLLSCYTDGHAAT